jgi:hypothetical protein
VYLLMAMWRYVWPFYAKYLFAATAALLPRAGQRVLSYNVPS